MSKKGCGLRECVLNLTKTEVPYTGNKKAKVVWIGDSPGSADERRRPPRPMMGDEGLLARECCEEAGLDWHSLFFMNSARCRIIKKEMPNKEIDAVLKHCREYVERALKVLKPKAIIAAGAFSLKQILKRGKITQSRGTWVWSDEFKCWVLPVFQPSYILRNQAFKPVLVSDLKMVQDFIDNDYEVYQADPEEFDYKEAQTISDYVKGAKVVAVDTETQGLDWTDPEHICISYSLTAKKGEGIDVVLFEETDEDNADYSFEWMRVPEGKKKRVPTLVHVKRAVNFNQKLDELQEFLENPKIKKYTMHGSYDMHVFRTLFKRERGIKVKLAGFSIDIQAAAHVYDENIFKMANLTMIQRHFAEYKDDYNREFELEFGKEDMLAVPAESRTRYACADTDVTMQCALTLRKWFMQPENKRLANYLARFVLPALDVLFVLEENGAFIDMEALPAVLDEVEGMMRESQLKALRAVPKKVLMDPDHKKKNRAKKNKIVLTRGDLVRDTLFTKEGFKLKAYKMTRARVPSVDKNVRAGLLDQRLPEKVRTFLTNYNDFSEYHTLWSRYLKGFQKWVKESTGMRIHSSMSLTTAVTGRAASSKPNMMNNPKRSASAHKIRRLIAAPKGYLLLAVDESQSELRWAAHVAVDPAMIKIFNDGKVDIHTATAMDLCDRVWSELTKDEIGLYRRNAKAVNFGLLFGMTVNGFIKYAKSDYGIDLSYDEAESWVMVFFTKYRRLPVYHKKTIEFCRRNGYVESPLGRRRRLPEIHSADKFLRLEAERQAINHPIQSPSSDTVLIACAEYLKRDIDPVECRPVMFIHDELIFEVKDNSKVSDYAKIVKYHMEHPPLKRDFSIDLAVPLVSEPKVGLNLYDMEDIEV